MPTAAPNVIGAQQYIRFEMNGGDRPTVAATTNRKSAMQIETAPRLWQRKRYRFSLQELAELSGLPEAELREWVNRGMLMTIDSKAARWLFGADHPLMTTRVARRLRKEIALEPRGLALVVMRLGRAQALETEIRALRAVTARISA